jgi:hypothetical protein
MFKSTKQGKTVYYSVSAINFIYMKSKNDTYQTMKYIYAQICNFT